MTVREEGVMTKRSRRINGVEPYADTSRDDDTVVRSAVSGRFVITEDQAKKLAALKAETRKPTSLPHGF